jgi:hypothetical protein
MIIPVPGDSPWPLTIGVRSATCKFIGENSGNFRMERLNSHVNRDIKRLSIIHLSIKCADSQERIADDRKNTILTGRPDPNMPW